MRPVAVVPPALPAPPRENVVRLDLYAEPEGIVQAQVDALVNTPAAAMPASEARVAPVEHSNRVEDRLARVREMSIRLRSPNGLSEMEREPAYRRKNVVLNDVPNSTDSTMSRYTLNEETDENGERRVELRRNNPFLHDNVD